ncbi:GNAT family N-acetyltransferase [Kurthia zopfii]|uniref:Protease synthase and sporulation negative regulatory protein PAI 1 n=2 Tax=Kurthia zopfii TaxID=1650 RepID=A0A8B4QE38_9BACL|nr:GNAT family N-acetyltransferase [Kurthia zopfii]PWI21477.1 GNAT family N-acetyltransferase [Kurthia zopfii]TDR34538.1 ribosomal protein S18 acetylase RimI-like enzyme [Kurthia zopfii]STX11011.1 Protease synthase and sporulation negative regulatory protein PAI 1 [Kurthia zopfii]
MLLVVRKMEKDDVRNVREIAINSWENTYKSIIPEIIQRDFLDMAYNEVVLKNRLENSPFYIAELDGELIGFANFSNVKMDGAVELSAIYMKPGFESRGVGTMLLNRGIEELKPKRIYVSVETENTSGMNFYKARNFKFESEYDDNFNGHILKTTRLFLEQ